MSSNKYKASCLAATFMLSGSAQAVDWSGVFVDFGCAPLLDSSINWAKQSPINFVEVTITSNASDRQVATYTSTSESNAVHQDTALEYQVAVPLSPYLDIPEGLHGHATTYYSDRRYPDTNAPYAPESAGTTQIDIRRHPTDSKLAEVILGGVKVEAECKKGHMFGFASDGARHTLYDLTFSNVTIPFITVTRPPQDYVPLTVPGK